MADQPTPPPPTDRKIVLGITGNIAVGKSTVVRRLVGFGAQHQDADLVYRDLVRPGMPLLASLVERFGRVILTPDGELDRRALGAIVFADPARLAELDALTHGPIIREVDRRVAAVHAGVVIIDSVKLIESGHSAVCDDVWLITAPETAQVERLIARNGWSREEAQARVDAQPPLAAKLAGANLVIANDGSMDALLAQVDAAWRRLVAPA